MKSQQLRLFRFCRGGWICWYVYNNSRLHLMMIKQIRYLKHHVMCALLFIRSSVISWSRFGYLPWRGPPAMVGGTLNASKRKNLTAISNWSKKGWNWQHCKRIRKKIRCHYLHFKGGMSPLHRRSILTSEPKLDPTFLTTFMRYFWALFCLYHLPF